MPRGFSLLELLVATAVFLGLALILVSIAGSLSNFWQMGIAHNERRSSALAAFARMARDLRFAAVPANPSATNVQFVINPAKVGSSYLYPQAAFWQAPVAAGGNTALVGYFVQWVNETNGSVPKLCRLVIGSASTNYQYLKPSVWISDPILANNAPAAKAFDYNGQLAENVLGLWMQPLDQRKNPIVIDASGAAFAPGQFDSTQGYTATLTNAYGTNSVTYAFKPALPASLEVAIVTTDARTAKRLSGNAAEKPPSRSTTNMMNDVNAFYLNLPEHIKKGARIYSTVIELHSAPR